MTSTVSYFAIVPAAGSGTRMQQAIPKQYLRIGGKAIIEHTINRLLDELRIDSVTVCLAENDRHWSELSIRHNARVQATVGGLTRAESVLNGLAAIADRAKSHDWVLVHDAVRPCLSQACLSSLIESVGDHSSGGILAVPSNDTLKLARSSGAHPTIEKTLDRSLIWQAQTPQMFRYGLLESALVTAMQENQAITDEASAMERAGNSVKLVKGEPTNIKITTVDDLLIAKLLIEKPVQ